MCRTLEIPKEPFCQWQGCKLWLRGQEEVQLLVWTGKGGKNVLWKSSAWRVIKKKKNHCQHKCDSDWLFTSYIFHQIREILVLSHPQPTIWTWTYNILLFLKSIRCTKESKLPPRSLDPLGHYSQLLVAILYRMTSMNDESSVSPPQRAAVFFQPEHDIASAGLRAHVFG